VQQEVFFIFYEIGIASILLNPFRQKRSGVDCDVIVKNVNTHLTVGKYWRLTNEITDYKIVALEFIFLFQTVTDISVDHSSSIYVFSPLR
jgi:hypothetical protein